MQLSAIRQRGEVEGIIIMHVSASYIDWHTSVLVPSSGQGTLHHYICVMCCAVPAARHRIVCYQFP